MRPSSASLWHRPREQRHAQNPSTLGVISWNVCLADSRGCLSRTVQQGDRWCSGWCLSPMGAGLPRLQGSEQSRWGERQDRPVRAEEPCEGGSPHPIPRLITAGGHWARGRCCQMGLHLPQRWPLGKPSAVLRGVGRPWVRSWTLPHAEGRCQTRLAWKWEATKPRPVQSAHRNMPWMRERGGHLGVPRPLCPASPSCPGRGQEWPVGMGGGIQSRFLLPAHPVCTGQGPGSDPPRAAWTVPAPLGALGTATDGTACPASSHALKF